MSKEPVRNGEPGDLTALRARLWDAVTTAHSLLKSRTNDTRLRAIHALSQSASAYRALVETSDLERRISALEAAKEAEDVD